MGLGKKIMTKTPQRASIVAMRNHFAIFALLCALTVAAPSAYGQNIQIFNGADVDFGQWLPGDGNQTNDQFFCVYKDSGDTLWDAEANGSGAGGAFELTDGSNTLSFSNVQIETTSMTAGVLETGFPGADNTGSPDCTEYGGDNQRLRLEFSGAALGSTAPGTYTGTISITATP